MSPMCRGCREYMIDCTCEKVDHRGLPAPRSVPPMPHIVPPREQPTDPLRVTTRTRLPTDGPELGAYMDSMDSAYAEARIEAAYWEFDARKNGYSPFTFRRSERDAFKQTIRRMLNGGEAIP